MKAECPKCSSLDRLNEVRWWLHCIIPDLECEACRPPPGFPKLAKGGGSGGDTEENYWARVYIGRWVHDMIQACGFVLQNKVALV